MAARRSRRKSWLRLHNSVTHRRRAMRNRTLRLNRMIRLRLLLAVFALLCSGTWCFAGAPMGVSNMTVSVPVDGCMHRAARALEREGYAVSPGNDNVLWGNMGPHHAVVICTAAPGGLTQVSIVVASLPPETPDSAVRESSGLKRRMEEIGRDRDWDRRR